MRWGWNWNQRQIHLRRAAADLIIIYNSGRFRMAGHGSTAGLLAYGDANAEAMDIGEFEVLPVVEEIPVICGVHGSDPRRRMRHHLLKVKEMGFWCKQFSDTLYN